MTEPLDWTRPAEPSTPSAVPPWAVVQAPPAPRFGWKLPALLYAVTALSTWAVGGPVFCVWLMGILTAHELGHFVQARRYGVPASFPYFLPMPFSPLGTMGAVIVMGSRMPNRRVLFDVGITGPLAGLVPALVATVVGLQSSRVVPESATSGGLSLGEPLLFKLAVRAIFGVLPEGQTVELGPLAYAGWVGILLTAINLAPLGQLDGGHILYALLRRRAHVVAQAVLVAAAVVIVVQGLWGWTLMVALLAALGVHHPPTADDQPPLGLPRVVLGWLTLLFFVVGVTPEPFVLP